MGRSPAQKAGDAADALLGWLAKEQAATRGTADPGKAAQGQAGVETARHGHPPPAPAAHPDGNPDQAAHLPARAGEERGPGAPLRLPHPDWLHHRLVVTGVAPEVAALRRAAAGPGEVPWPLDPDPVEEGMLHLLLWPPAPGRRTLSAAGARALAGQLREASALRHGAVLARAGRSRACPFDLHQLVPVPEAVLRLGPDHPDAVRWLWEHWGTTEMLRGVQEDRLATLGRHPVLRQDPGALHLSFWSADWTPWRALADIAGRWTALRFDTLAVTMNFGPAVLMNTGPPPAV